MKFATIGTGFIVENFLEAVSMQEDASAIAVYSRKESTGKALADKFRIKQVYTDYEEMLQNTEIDCIYIASPNSLHYPQAKQALLAGKHVLCEKPFTSTVQELEELITIAKKKDLFLMEAIVTLHMPNYRNIKEQLTRLGRIRMVQCNFSQYSSKYDAFKNGDLPNVFNPNFSGGALSDINIYNLHFVTGLFGVPDDIKYYPNMQKDIDTSGVLVLHYPDFQAVCIGCKDCRAKNNTQIQGEQGTLVIESETSRCMQVDFYNKNGTTSLTLQQHTNVLYYEVKDFIQMVKDHNYVYCHALLDHSKDVLSLYERARLDAGIYFPSDKKGAL